MKTATKQSRVLIVDHLNTFIRSWVVVPVKNRDGEHYGGVYGYLQSLKSAVDRLQPTEVVIAMDGPKGGLRRKQLFPDYKSNRQTEWKRGSIRAFDFMSEHEQRDNFVMQLRRIGEYLETLPIKTIRIPYIEADDIVAVYTQRLKEDSQVIIYSMDADFKQLINDQVSIYNPIKKTLVTRQSFIEQMGLEPCNYIVVKATKGDGSDNIPGLKGFGEKTIVKMFPELQDPTPMPIDEVIRKANEIGFSKAKSKEHTPGIIKKFQLIAESADQLRLNHRIMQLQDPEIGSQAKETIWSYVDESPQSFNSLGLKMMFIQDKLEHSVRNFSDWASSFAGLQTK